MEPRRSEPGERKAAMAKLGPSRDGESWGNSAPLSFRALILVGPHFTTGKITKLHSHCRIHHGGPSKIKHRITTGPSNPISGYTSKSSGSRDAKRYLQTHVHRNVT